MKNYTPEEQNARSSTISPYDDNPDPRFIYNGGAPYMCVDDSQAHHNDSNYVNPHDRLDEHGQTDNNSYQQHTTHNTSQHHNNDNSFCDENNIRSSGGGGNTHPCPAAAIKVRDESHDGKTKERMIPLEPGTNKLLLSVLRTRFTDAEGLCFGANNEPVPKEITIEDGQEITYLVLSDLKITYAVDYRLGEEPIIGIALSGGGTRAAMTAVGALRRLWELGILQRATTISSVSGGGLVNAMLALNWAKMMEQLNQSPESKLEIWNTYVARPVRKLCESNIALKVFAYNCNPVTMAKIWTRQLQIETEKAPLSNANLLSTELCKIIPELNTSMAELPKGPGVPNFVFCACDMTTGRGFYFTQDFVGPNLELLLKNAFCRARNNNNNNDNSDKKHGEDFVTTIANDFLNEMEGLIVGKQQEGTSSPCTLSEKMSQELAGKLKLCDAVASSATYPLIFDPFEIDVSYLMHGKGSTESVIRLTDGGVYDNIGLDPLLMSARVAKKKTMVFINDAQPSNKDGYKPGANWVSRNTRAIDIIHSQLTADKIQSLREKYRNHELYGAYWSLKMLGPKIFGDMNTEVLKGALNFPGPEIFHDNSEIIDIIKGFRTDLNKIDSNETAMLENTGYLLAAYRFQKVCACVLSRLEGKPSDTYFVPFEWPHACGLLPPGGADALQHSNNLVGSLLHGNKKDLTSVKFYGRGLRRSVEEITKSIGDFF